MNVNLKTLAAALVGVVICGAAVDSVRAQSKAAPGYLVVEFQVTDPVGWKSYVDAARALPTAGISIVRATKGVPLDGEPPKTITIFKFPSVDEALAFDASPAYTALKVTRDKSSNWRSYVVEGLPN